MDKGSAPPYEPSQMQQATPSDAPPSYDVSQGTSGAAPYPPAGGAVYQPPYPQAAPYPPAGQAGAVYPHLPNEVKGGPPPAAVGAGTTVITQVVHVQAPRYGFRPVNMTCPHCNQNITTATQSEPSAMAYVISAVLCVLQLYCCVCIPCCIDSLQSTTHKCPNCKHFLGRYSGNGSN